LRVAAARGIIRAADLLFAQLATPGIAIMPIFEYTCAACGNEFETLVRGSSSTVECPNCHGTDLKKKLSAFASPSGAAAGMAEWPSACQTCGNPDGPGSCGLK